MGTCYTKLSNNNLNSVTVTNPVSDSLHDGTMSDQMVDIRYVATRCIDSSTNAAEIDPNPVNNTDSLESINDPKHNKYKNSYKANDIYFGLGIENETYLMFDKAIDRTGDWILKNRQRERYSVNYWLNFNSTDVENVLCGIKTDKIYKLPVFMNSHSLTKCDSSGQHMTINTKGLEKNPEFNGETIHDILMKTNSYFKDNYDVVFVYDGDTIEFTTLDFYNTTVDRCVGQLTGFKNKFLTEINNTFKTNKLLANHYDEKIKFSTNYGMVNFVSNPKNVAICNNSTYHINITLPTELNEHKKIKNLDQFVSVHKNAIRAIQWIEPLLIGCYGSPDIFASCEEVVNGSSDKFAKGSLRLALSRYISAGTYDTDQMVTGKLLDTFHLDEKFSNSDAKSVHCSDTRCNKRTHWYTKLHTNSGYVPQKTIGFDINFQKHYNHGIELRIFDYFPEMYLTDVINIILMVCQVSLLKNVPNPFDYPCFDAQLLRSIKNGSDDFVSIEYLNVLSSLLNDDTLINTSIHIDKTDTKDHMPKIFQIVSDELYHAVKDCDFLSKISPNMKRPIIHNYNKDMRDMNRNFIISGTY